MAKHSPFTLLCFFCVSVAFAQTETQNPVSPFWKIIGNSGTNSSTNFIGTIDNKSVRFRTFNTQRAVIDSLGNVGIGTATPTEKLDVSGNLRLSGALMPGNSAGTANQLLMSSGAGAAPTWSPFIMGNPSATTQIAKYYSTLSWNGQWTAGSSRTFTITDPDCVTGSSISVSFTGVNALKDLLNINNVQTANGSWTISVTNNTGSNLTGAVSISFIAFY